MTLLSDPTDVSVSVCNLYEEFDRNGREARKRYSNKAYSPQKNIHAYQFCLRKSNLFATPS